MKYWPTMTMAQVTRLVTDGKHGDCEDEKDSGYFFLSSKDLRDGRLHYDKPRQITHSGFLETHRRTKLEPGDILLANCGASIGRVGLAQTDPRIYKTTFQKSISVIKAETSIVDNRFLYYFVRHKSALLIRLGNGAAQPNLLIGDLKRIEVSVPPKPLQQRIAGILSAYDELIENSQRRIEILEAMARGLYREWFVHFRFPGHEDHPRVASALGEIPNGWKVRTLAELCSRMESGGTPRRNKGEYWEGGEIDWYKTGELWDGFLFGSQEQITARGQRESTARLFEPGTILMAIYGSPTVGRMGILTRAASCNQAALGLVANIKLISQTYLYFVLFSLREHFNSLAQGAAQQNISKEKVASALAILPTRDILEQFDRKAEPVFLQIQTLQRQVQNLRRTRDLLLPRLLSGQIDIEGIDG